MSIPPYRGEEMPVFALPPNWETANPVLSAREETSVLEALDQSEERWQRFPRPLYGIRFEATAPDSRQQGSFRKLFETAEAKPFGMPLWTETVELASDAAEGANTLSVTSMDGTLFSALSYLMLWADVDKWEVLKYSDVTFQDSIPLTQFTTRAWPAGTKVIPMAWGYCKRPDFQSLGSDNSRIPIEFEERILFGSTREYEYWPTVVTTVEYTPCYDEISLSWGDLPASVQNIEISHAASADGPWLWWGETRQRTSGVSVSNYFKTRWLRVRALSESGAVLLKVFKPEAPAVDPPTVEVFQRAEGSDKSTRVACGVGNKPAEYTGPRPSSGFGAGWQLPYGGGYAGVDTYVDGEPEPDTGRDRIAAVYPGNRVDPVSGIEMYRLNFHSDAFVEVGWRYMPDTSWERNAGFGKAIDVVLSSEQEGVTAKFTLDGTDPSESNGLSSDAGVFPWPIPFVRTPFVPYVIARCFKDGCKSPPVYVPIELTYHSDVYSNPHQSQGYAEFMCGIWHRESDCTQVPEGDSTWPCVPPTAQMWDEVISEIQSSQWGLYPTRRLHEWGGDKAPRFDVLPPVIVWGPDPGGCPCDFFGGGKWKLDCFPYCADTFSWSYDSDNFDYVPAVDAFALMSATITGELSGAFDVPNPGPYRVLCPGLTAGGTIGMTDGIQALLSQNYSRAFEYPYTLKDYADLTDVRLAISCAAY